MNDLLKPIRLTYFSLILVGALAGKVLWEYRNLLFDLRSIERYLLTEELLKLEFPHAEVYLEEDEFVEGLQDVQGAAERFSKGPVVSGILKWDPFSNYEFRGRASLAGVGRMLIIREPAPNVPEGFKPRWPKDCVPDEVTFQKYHLSVGNGTVDNLEVILANRSLGGKNFGECYFQETWSAFFPGVITAFEQPATSADLEAEIVAHATRWGITNDTSLDSYKVLRARLQTQSMELPLLSVSLPVVPAMVTLVLISTFYSISILSNLRAVLSAGIGERGSVSDRSRPSLDRAILMIEKWAWFGAYVGITLTVPAVTILTTFLLHYAHAGWLAWLLVGIGGSFQGLTVPTTIWSWARLYGLPPFLRTPG